MAQDDRVRQAGLAVDVEEGQGALPHGQVIIGVEHEALFRQGDGAGVGEVAGGVVHEVGHHGALDLVSKIGR